MGAGESAAPDTGVVLVTDDGGASWQQAPLPRYVGVSIPEVTCPDAAHCTLLGYVMGPGEVTSPDGDQGPNQWLTPAEARDAVASASGGAAARDAGLREPEGPLRRRSDR